MKLSIDLNADLGEGAGHDEELFQRTILVCAEDSRQRRFLERRIEGCRRNRGAPYVLVRRSADYNEDHFRSYLDGATAPWGLGSLAVAFGLIILGRKENHG